MSAQIRESSESIDNAMKVFEMESPIIEYILLAEFDIDKGSVVRHQFPNKIGVDDGLLSEYMMPEGAHSRESDSTVFFIRPYDLSSAESKEDRSSLDESKKLVMLKKKWVQKVETLASKLQLSARCFMHDSESRQWKPLMLQEDQFSRIMFQTETEKNYCLLVYESEVSNKIAKVIPITEDLQFSVTDEDNYISLGDENGDPFALMFSHQEELLQFEQTMFRLLDALKGVVPVGSLQLLDEDVDEEFKRLQEEKNQLICLNIVRTKMDASVRRGAVVKSMAFCSRRAFIYSFKGFIMFCLNHYFELTSEEQELAFLGSIFEKVNQLDLSAQPKLSFLERQIYKASKANASAKSGYIDECKVYIDFMNVKLPIIVPTMLDDDEVGGTSIRELVQKFEKHTMTIYNAILCGKRVLFLGHGLAAEQVSNCVLSACRLVSPPLSGILKRAFPYAHLTDIRFLEVEGYIAGVTNPIFQQHSLWWDLICDVPTGTVLFNPEYEQELSKANLEEMSHGLDCEILDTIRSGLAMNLSEEWLHCKFRDYTQRIYDIVSGDEIFKSDQERMIHTRSNRFRIAQLVQTRLYKENQIRDRWIESRSYFGKQHSDMKRYIRTLQVKKVSLKEVKRLYRFFRQNVNSHGELMQFLSMLPESRGGLFPIAVGLFHEADEVKKMTIDLLSRLDLLKEGSMALNNLNYMILLTFHKHKDSRGARTSFAFAEDEKLRPLSPSPIKL